MRPHRTDGISLSFGLIFLLAALWWAVAQVVTVRLPAVGWLVAGALILFGGLGLIGAIRSGRRTQVAAPVQAEAPVAVPGDLPPELHADIVRELLDNPADRTDLHPAYLSHPVSEPVSGLHPAYLQHPATEPVSGPPTTGVTRAEPAADQHRPAATDHAADSRIDAGADVVADRDADPDVTRRLH